MVPPTPDEDADADVADELIPVYQIYNELVSSNAFLLRDAVDAKDVKVMNDQF